MQILFVAVMVYKSTLIFLIILYVSQPPFPYARSHFLFPSMAIHYDPFTTEYTVPTHGDVIIRAVYTNVFASADAWIDRIERTLAASKEKVVGADVEFTPRGYRQRAAVLQLCVGQDCLVYHVVCSADGVSSKFSQFLRNRQYKFASFDISSDVVMLSRSEHILSIFNHIDIQRIRRDPDLDKTGKQGMKDVAGALIDKSHKEMKGGITNADHQLWDKAPLS